MNASAASARPGHIVIEEVSAKTTGGLARDRDVAGVATELADVGLYPAQGGLLVHESVVACCAARPRCQCRVGEEAEGAEAVVDGGDDDARRRLLCRVVVAAGVLGEPAALNPHEHRSGASVGSGQRRCGHVR